MIRLFQNLDLRVNLCLVVVNAIAVMFLVNEVYFLILFLVACLWLCLPLKAFKFAVAYGLLMGISMLTLGVSSLSTFWLFSNIMRHLLIPIAYTDGLTEAPTGKLLGVFQKLRFPKSFGISTVVLLRFIPTISYELKSIRNSLKFRGVGMSFFDTLGHLPLNFERTMVPLLIRVTRISEELAAAAMVRGVKMNNNINSFDEVFFQKKDLGVLLLLIGLSISVCLAQQWEVIL